MKRLIAIGVLALLTTGMAYSQDGDMHFKWDYKISRVQATVHFLEDSQTIVLLPKDNASQRYISLQLPDEYKIEGLEVTLNGIVAKIPPHIRMLGTPLKITKIWVSKEVQEKYKLKKGKYCKGATK